MKKNVAEKPFFFYYSLVENKEVHYVIKAIFRTE